MPELEKDLIACINQTEEVLTPQLIEAYNILFQSTPELVFPTTFEVEPEKLEHFRQTHGSIYHEQAQEITSNISQFSVIYSGMFGGKTTLAFEIEDSLEKKGLKVFNAIAECMGEPYVTARSYLHGSTRREAFRFGGENYQEQIKQLINNNSDYIFLDEFSFIIPTNPVLELIEACQKVNKGLLLTGLDTNFLGDAFPIFQENSPILTSPKIQKHSCKSFVSGICEEVPQGTNSIRYAYVDTGNGCKRWMYDLGIYSLVVSKEHSHIVHYIPAMKEHSAKYLLENNPELQNAILHPTIEEETARHKLLERNISMNHI